MTKKPARRLVLLSTVLVAGTFTGCISMSRPARPAWTYFRTNAIPDKLPLGSVVRAHYHTQESNAEAGDFIFHRNDFIGHTAELTIDAKDRLLEVGARMRSAPYPVIIQRTRNNHDPELDSLRRGIIAQILTDLGNRDAATRVIVAPTYSKGLNSLEATADYYRFVFTRGFGNNNGNNGGGGFGGGGGGFGGGF